MNRIRDYLLSHIEDFLILAGILLIVTATFLINFLAGMYVTGLILVLFGVWFMLHPLK